MAVSAKIGFNIEATTATAHFLKAHGIRTRILGKPSEGSEEILDSIRAGYVSYVVNETTCVHISKIQARPTR